MELLKKALVFFSGVMKNYGKAELNKGYRLFFLLAGVVCVGALLIFFLAAAGVFL